MSAQLAGRYDALHGDEGLTEYSQKEMDRARRDLADDVFQAAPQLADILDGHTSEELAPLLLKLLDAFSADDMREAKVEIRDYLNRIVAGHFSSAAREEEVVKRAAELREEALA